MNSWTRLACYPRSTFYPLSDGPSIQNHRITKTDFRPCLKCLSCSQASLCLCTLRTLSKRSEETFARLRYILGGDRPSQTTYQTVSPSRIYGTRLDFPINQGGISRATPVKLALHLQRLPPILHKLTKKPLPSYSQGSRGLSVLLRVNRIFTTISISLRTTLRQRPDRYAIRAGSELTRQGISLP